MSKLTGLYPSLTVNTTAKRVVSQAGAVLLVATAGKIGLDRALSAALSPWRKQWAVLDPGKILLDLVISVAIGGDCLADIGLLRAEPAVFGRVASDRPSRGWSMRWRRHRPRRWRRSTKPELLFGNGCGSWPVSMPPTIRSARTGRWSLTWMPR